jgi:hypothetical protein
VRNTIYVAVVHKCWGLSGSRDGQWASFVDQNKKTAIAQAMAAREKWEARGSGPYRIWVGTLTEAIQMPMPQPTYVLESIES